MKKNFVVLAVFAVVILCGTMVASAQKKAAPVSIAGVYENFTVGKGSGDLEGMRVVFFNAGNKWHAIAQIAGGGAEDPDPEMVPLTITGKNFEFKVGEMTYKGTVTAAGLKVKYEEGPTELVKRKSCSSFF